MASLGDKIYDMHGKVESLETWAKSIDSKLDAALNPERKCNRLQKIEKIGIVALILLGISLLANPITAAFAKQIVPLIQVLL